MFNELKEKYKLLKNHTLNNLAGINVNGILLSQNSNNTFEVVCCNSARKPQTSNLRNLWKTRRQGTAVPLIVVCEYWLWDGHHPKTWNGNLEMGSASSREHEIETW